MTKRGNVPVGKAAVRALCDVCTRMWDGWIAVDSHSFVSSSPQQREDQPPVSPVLLGFFIFVVVGSGTCIHVCPLTDALESRGASLGSIDWARVSPSTATHPARHAPPITALFQIIRTASGPSPF